MIRRRQTSGFSLVEALIGIFVVVLGSTSTISLLTFIRLHNTEEQERARAHQMVSEEMDNLLGELFPQIEPSQSVVIWDNGTPDIATDDTPGTMTIEVRDGDNNVLSSVPTPWEKVQVEVSVSWNARGRRADAVRHESVMTYVAPK